MNTCAKHPNYEEFLQILECIGETNASFLHGVMVSHICLNKEFDVQKWVAFVLKSNPLIKIDEIQKDKFLDVCEALANLYQLSIKQLDDMDMSFELFLPDDLEDLEYRTQALCDWVMGYLEFFKSGVAQVKLSKEGQELIDYFEEVKLIVLDGDDTETNEKAYFEIVEYMRMAIIFLFLESSKASKAVEDLVH